MHYMNIYIFFGPMICLVCLTICIYIYALYEYIHFFCPMICLVRLTICIYIYALYEYIHFFWSYDMFGSSNYMYIHICII